MSTTPNPMQHAEFEALLNDALEGTLDASLRERFDGHRSQCQPCRLMFAEAHAGMLSLRSLELLEPPAHLVERILAATSGTARQPAIARKNWWEKARLRELLGPTFQPVLQPRFAMSFAMAFFSISLILSLAGVRLQNFRLADLRPAALRDTTVRTYYETQARVVKYYENLRLVYEIESRVRELKNTQQQESEPAPSRPKPKPNDKSTGEKEQKLDQWYSQERSLQILAESRSNDWLTISGILRSEA